MKILICFAVMAAGCQAYPTIQAPKPTKASKLVSLDVSTTTPPTTQAKPQTATKKPVHGPILKVFDKGNGDLWTTDGKKVYYFSIGKGTPNEKWLLPDWDTRGKDQFIHSSKIREEWEKGNPNIYKLEYAPDIIKKRYVEPANRKPELLPKPAADKDDGPKVKS